MDALHWAVSEFLRAAGVGRGASLLAAVSGGADSTALARVLAALGQRCGVAHVHHGARGADADRDCAAAADTARELGLPFHAARVAIGPGRPGSWEARARAERYAALAQLRGAHGYAWVATAHTLDDQAETVLMRALRGTRLEGLAGIDAVCEPRRLLRPLLGARGAALRAYLRARGAPWCEDASNRDPRHLRSRLRLRALPELEALQPGAAQHLAELAEQARALRELRRGALQGWLALGSEPGEGGRWVSAAAWAALAPAECPDAMAALLREQCPPERLRRAHLTRALEFAAAARVGQRLSLPGGCALLRDRDAFWLGAGPGPRWPVLPARLLEPGEELWLPQHALRLRWRALGAAQPRAETRTAPGAAADAAAPSALRIGAARGPLALRSPQPGDRLRAAGGTVALAAALRGARSSLRARRRALVVADAQAVLWIAGEPGVRDACAAGAQPVWELVAERVSAAVSSC